MSFLGIDDSHTAQWLHCPTQNNPLVNCHQTCSPHHSPPQLASPPLSRCQDKTCKSLLTPHTASINRLRKLCHQYFSPPPSPCPSPPSWWPSADSCPLAAKQIPSHQCPDYKLSMRGFHAPCLPGSAQCPWPPPGATSLLHSALGSPRRGPTCSHHRPQRLLSSLPERFFPYFFVGLTLHHLSLSSSGAFSERSPLITPSEAEPLIPIPASYHCHS